MLFRSTDHLSHIDFHTQPLHTSIHVYGSQYVRDLHTHNHKPMTIRYKRKIEFHCSATDVCNCDFDHLLQNIYSFCDAAEGSEKIKIDS